MRRFNLSTHALYPLPQQLNALSAGLNASDMMEGLATAQTAAALLAQRNMLLQDYSAQMMPDGAAMSAAAPASGMRVLEFDPAALSVDDLREELRVRGLATR